VEVRPIEAVGPAELDGRCGRAAGARRAAVVLESVAPGAIRGRLVLDPARNRANSAPALEHLGDGVCAIAVGGPNLL
jgi:hypothetical protein